MSGLIVFRYLSREVLVTLTAVSSVLLIIILSGRFIRYLESAAQGLMDPGVLMMVMAFAVSLAIAVACMATMPSTPNEKISIPISASSNITPFCAMGAPLRIRRRRLML